MISANLNQQIPQQWLEFATASPPHWDERERQEPFLPDTRITPIGLTSAVKPDHPALSPDRYPLRGLGFYADEESVAHFSTMCGLVGLRGDSTNAL